MTTDPRDTEDENLRFFGIVVASISHEIKNVMAIINEKAGLLKDLTLMAQKGMALDMNRVQSIADDMRSQIKRSDAIIKNMNKFAHSVDEEVQQVNLNELTALMTILSERFASRLGVTLSFQSLQTDVIIRTHPFRLEYMIWHCIHLAMGKCAEPKTLTVAVEKSGQSAQVKFIFNSRESEKSSQLGNVDRLLRPLKAEIIMNVREPQMILSLPADISAQES
jgi:C4-dicarboxylate-specific signal transduction histidine kinase